MNRRNCLRISRRTKPAFALDRAGLGIRLSLVKPGDGVPRRSKRPDNSPRGRQGDDLGSRSRPSCRERATARTLRWRRERRRHDLRIVARRFKRLRWSPKLVELLLEELYVTDEAAALLAPIRRLRIKQYPQLIAVALALRHSWRPDDLREITKRLGVTRRRNGLRH